MAPIALLSGLIGLGFGSLNANKVFLIPSISPVISSLTLIILVGCFWLQEGSAIQSKELAVKGGVILALATLIGALFQWIIQLPLLIRKSSWRLNLIWDWRHPGAREVLKIISPAILCAITSPRVLMPTTAILLRSGFLSIIS